MELVHCRDLKSRYLPSCGEKITKKGVTQASDESSLQDAVCASVGRL